MTTPVPVALLELAAEVEELAAAIDDIAVEVATTPPNMERLGAARQRAEDVKDAVREMRAQWEAEQ